MSRPPVRVATGDESRDRRTTQSRLPPHNFEILSGQLCAPGLPDVAEKAFLARLMNSWGKTWHSWPTGRHDGEPGSRLTGTVPIPGVVDVREADPTR